MTAMSPAVKEQQKAARARAGRIRMGIRSYIHTLGDIAAAYAADDWKTLGYTSWAAYVGNEFSADAVRLPIEQRQKAVDELRLSGMPNRAIAAALNVNEATIRRDAGAANAAVIDGEIVDLPAETPNETAGAASGGSPAPAPNHREPPPGDEAGSPGPADQGESGDTGRDTPASSAGAGTCDPAPDVQQVSTPSGTAAAGGEVPAAAPQRPCEQCGTEMPEDVYDAGFTRCAACDPDGEHQVCRHCGRPL